MALKSHNPFNLKAIRGHLQTLEKACPARLLGRPEFLVKKNVA